MKTAALSPAQTQRIVAQVINALQYVQIDWMLPQMYSGGVLVDNIRLDAATPTIELRENDQTAPAGQYRIQVASDLFAITRATAAEFATTREYFAIDIGNDVVSLENLASTSSRVEAIAGTATADKADLVLTAASGGGTFSLLVGDGSASYKNALNMNKTRAAFGVPITGGKDSSIDNIDLVLRSNVLATDSTSTDIYLQTLNPAADAYVTVAHAVPTGTPTTPFFEMRANGTTPTDPIMAANFSYIRWESATDTITYYVNDGGVIRSLVLGVAV